jgi:hypothetical protein
MPFFPKAFLATSLVILTSFCALAQNAFFSDIQENDIRPSGKRVILPSIYRTTAANTSQLRAFLWALPAEKNVDRTNAPVLSIPKPDGTMARFRVWESSIVEPGLQAKFSEIRTFAGQGIDDPYATIRLDYSPYNGFHAQVLTINGAYYIDPYARGNISNYISYFTADNQRDPGFACETTEADLPEGMAGKVSGILAGPCRGTQLYTYRLAVACTGEYAVAVGGTTPASLHAAIVTTVNRVDGVYELELSVRLILVANNDQIEYLDATADPFAGNNNATTLITESQTVITNLIGTTNFDIGHTFSTGGGGLAGLGVVCNSGSKARGITGSSFPVGDNYDIDYVAHEMGHQFGGSHTFNSTTSNCGGGNRSAANAYEVGSGTTIQAYAGICGTDNIQPHSDPYFHAISFDQISNYIEGGGSSCKVVISTGNTLPQILTMNNNNANIPLNTPFTLNGTATDANGDAITYNWEEWDLGTGGAWNNGSSSTTAPLFKSRVPKTTGSRTFPDMAVILAGFPASPTAVMGGLKGETLPQTARVIKFRLTVRDNRAGGGGITSGGSGCQADMAGVFQVNAIAGTGPFVVTIPNGGESYPGGTAQTITWSVAGTDAAPISCANVRITMSTDGGVTYPFVISAGTPNDGSEVLVLPSTVTSLARVRIEGVGNIFFDISNNNFSLTAPASDFTFDNPAAASIACAGPATASVNLGTVVSGSFSTPINLSASNVPAGATISFGTNPLTPGSSTSVTLNNAQTLSSGTYNVTITGVAGTVTHTRVVTFTVQTGAGPSLTTPPASLMVCSGSNANFNVTASGATGYQWMFSTDGVNFSDISGAINPAITLNAVTATQDNFKFKVLVRGQCNSVLSSVGTLTVLNPPALTTQPLSASICSGSPNVFSTVATGTNTSYQWQLSSDGGTTFNNITGAGAATFSTGAATPGMNQYQYRVVVSGTCAPVVTSSSAVLTVSSPVAITGQPQNMATCATGNASFVISSNSSSYQWQVSTDGGASYNNIPGSTTGNTLTISNVQPSMNNNSYRAILTNGACAQVVSNPAVLTVYPMPQVTLSASPYTSLLPGQNTVLSAVLNPATGMTTSWYRNGTLLPGIVGNSLTVDVNSMGSYQVKVSDANGCKNQSSIVTIDDSASSSLFIFPSPNNGRFSIAYYNSTNSATTQDVAVYAASGALVFHKIFEVNQVYQIHQVNLMSAASGIYMVVVRDAGGKILATGKVMIKH